MGINSIKALVELVDEPEIIPFLDRCGKPALTEVECILHNLVAVQGHPSAAYRARVRTGLLNEIWDIVYGFYPSTYIKGFILKRVEYLARTKGLHDINRELLVLANLWDASESKEDLDAECNAIENWDWPFLEENYLYPTPSPEAVMSTAGCAMYYVLNGDMTGMVSAREAAEYFGWEI